MISKYLDIQVCLCVSLTLVEKSDRSTYFVIIRIYRGVLTSSPPSVHVYAHYEYGIVENKQQAGTHKPGQ